MAVGGFVAGWLARALSDGRVTREEVEELFFGVLDVAGLTGAIDIIDEAGKFEDQGLTPGPVPIPGPLDPPGPNIGESSAMPEQSAHYRHYSNSKNK